MGYTHYWHRPLEIEPDKMQVIADDFAKVVLTLDDMGVHLADGLGHDVPQITPELIHFNGREYRDEDDSYETLSFPRTMNKGKLLQPSDQHPGLYLAFCKTARCPYDLAVVAFLIIAKHHLGDRIAISSCGEIQDWMNGIELCRTYLGYDERYVFNADEELTAEVPVA
jgi:hypothetical protein